MNSHRQFLFHIVVDGSELLQSSDGGYICIPQLRKGSAGGYAQWTPTEFGEWLQLHPPVTQAPLVVSIKKECYHMHNELLRSFSFSVINTLEHCNWKSRPPTPNHYQLLLHNAVGVDCA